MTFYSKTLLLPFTLEEYKSELEKLNFTFAVIMPVLWVAAGLGSLWRYDFEYYWVLILFGLSFPFWPLFFFHLLPFGKIEFSTTGVKSKPYNYLGVSTSMATVNAPFTAFKNIGLRMKAGKDDGEPYYMVVLQPSQPGAKELLWGKYSKLEAEAMAQQISELTRIPFYNR